MRLQGLARTSIDAVKYWSAYAYKLQHLPQQAAGNDIKRLLEIYKAGVQFAMRLFLLVNQRLGHKDIICCAKVFSETCLSCGFDAFILSPDCYSVVQNPMIIANN